MLIVCISGILFVMLVVFLGEGRCFGFGGFGVEFVFELLFEEVLVDY